MGLIKLTEFSHGAGCGCKIAPDVLSSIIATTSPQPECDRLIVGNDSNDDAAVYDLGDGSAIISTTDFFTPIADDAATFGRIAAANALSDVYAMGGRPLMAIAILGWPVDKLSADVAAQVVEGGRAICREAGIPLAGGHSIDSPEPIFGLAVTGRVELDQLKRNVGAQAGDLLYLTKALGVGVLTTAQKQKKLAPEHAGIAVESMTKLNSIGADIAALPYVHAMTDVTGFGLGGHLLEMCRGARLSAQLCLNQLPLLPQVQRYLDMGCVPGGTERNYHAFSDAFNLSVDTDYRLVCDPQTSGGLLVAVDPDYQQAFEQRFAQQGWQVIGEFLKASGQPTVVVS